ncbi:MAG: hypothetical protein KJ666_10120 [Bacteroidetes bacterium]|nr:hypothetical protein [Bacteroidota bacterium]
MDLSGHIICLSIPIGISIIYELIETKGNSGLTEWIVTAITEFKFDLIAHICFIFGFYILFIIVESEGSSLLKILAYSLIIIALIKFYKIYNDKWRRWLTIKMEIRNGWNMDELCSL